MAKIKNTLAKFWTPRVLRTTSLASLTAYDFSEFWPPSCILAEMEEVVYLKNHKRSSDFRQSFDTPLPQGTKDYSFNTSENLDFSDFQHHLVYWQKWKISFISKTAGDRATSGKCFPTE